MKFAFALLVIVVYLQSSCQDMNQIALRKTGLDEYRGARKDFDTIWTDFKRYAKRSRSVQGAIRYLQSLEWKTLSKNLSSQSDIEQFRRFALKYDTIYMGLNQHFFPEFFISNNVLIGYHPAPSLAPFINAWAVQLKIDRARNTFARIVVSIGHPKENEIKTEFDNLWRTMSATNEYKEMERQLDVLGINLYQFQSMLRDEIVILDFIATFVNRRV